MKKFLVFAFVVAVALAFSPLNYTYENETVNLSEYNFTLDGQNYTIFYFNETPVFLYRWGDVNPITDLNEIENILFKHFSQNYYLNQSDIEYIKERLEVFNESRNNGDQFRGIEEYACRRELGEALPTPSNLDIYGGTIYDFYATYLCMSDFGDAIGCTRKEDIKPYVVSFFENSYGIDRDLSNIYLMLDNMSPSNVYEYLINIENNISSIEKEVSEIKKSRFRLPIGGTKECPDCWGVCAELVVNQTALNEIKEKVDELKNKTYFLGNYKEMSNTIFNETKNRLEYLKTKNLKDYYSTKLSIIVEDWNKKKPLVDESLSLINNKTIAYLKTRIETLIDEINGSLQNNSFDDLEEKINETEHLVDKIDDKALNNKNLYLAIVSESNKVENMFLLLKEYGEDLSPYEDKKKYLDANFVKGISAEKAVEFLDEYKNLSTTLSNKVKDRRKAEFGGNILNAIVRSMTNSVYQLIEDLPYEKRKAYVNNLPLIMAIISALSIASLATWVMIYKYVIDYKKYSSKKNKMAYMTIMFAVVAVLILAGLLTFFLFDGAINHGRVSDFLYLVKSSPSVTLVLDLSNADQSKKEAIENCGNLILSELQSYGKEVTYITLYNSFCKVNETSYGTKEDCLNAIKPPYIMLSYDKEVVYNSRTAGEISLEVKGNSAYFDKCPVAYFLEVG